MYHLGTQCSPLTKTLQKTIYFSWLYSFCPHQHSS
ncbi:hypothetical protein CIB84_011212 [Bambusicola thoracicus]|uniref:Uncharacterized protein n=1 Tax=Bambusicola thoracicus TaxID=9083 RepID=A0A2P4SLR0_BAMTH|nr:hypothetical protein CIB84_011212 [Bambusicola thoracicus]